MYLLMIAVLLHIVVMFRPWKQEWLGAPNNKYFEISMWHICRFTKKSTKCYEGELDDAPGEFDHSFLCIVVDLQSVTKLVARQGRI